MISLQKALRSAVPGLLVLLSCSVALPASAESLQEALVAVYNKNPRLQAERARVREVDENYVQARAQGRLSATASGSYARSALRSPEQGSVFQPASGENNIEYGPPKQAQIQVVQPIYQGGRVKALKRQAKAGVLAARESLRASENSIFLAAANAYVDVLRDEEAAQIRRNNVRVLDRQLVAARERFNVGEGTRTDIAQSESRLAQSEAGLAQADAQLQVSRAGYKRIVGRVPANLQKPPRFVRPRDLPTAIALARDNNPQLISAYFNEEAGSAAIDVAKSAGRPTFSISANLAAQRDQLFGLDRSEQAAITANVTVPIFSGGLNSSRVRQAKHAKTRLAFESRDTEMAVDQTVAQIWAQLDAAEQTLIAGRKQEESAQIAFEGVELEQTVGTRTQLDVLNAEQEVLNARLTVVNAEREVNAASFQLLSTIGVFDADGISLPVDEYDPSQNFEHVRYKGTTEMVDKFVPEIVQVIAEDSADFVEANARGVVGLAKKSPIPGLVDDLGTVPATLSKVAKTQIDKGLGMEGGQSEWLGQPLPKIETEPFGAPLPVPADPLLAPEEPLNVIPLIGMDGIPTQTKPFIRRGTSGATTSPSPVSADAMQAYEGSRTRGN